jgi:hypothetical protein
MVTVPPDTEVESPPTTDTLAPAPPDEEPPATSTAPAIVAPVPLPINTDPLVVSLAPLFNETSPLLAVPPTLELERVDKIKLPPDTAPLPLITSTDPPFEPLDEPPSTETSPPVPCAFNEPAIFKTGAAVALFVAPP